jgi:hypothetical protein
MVANRRGGRSNSRPMPRAFKTRTAAAYRRQRRDARARRARTWVQVDASVLLVRLGTAAKTFGVKLGQLFDVQLGDFESPPNYSRWQVATTPVSSTPIAVDAPVVGSSPPAPRAHRRRWPSYLVKVESWCNSYHLIRRLLLKSRISRCQTRQGVSGGSLSDDESKGWR